MISVLRAWLNQVTKASACSKELLIRHQNALTEEAWEDTVQGVGNLCVSECEHSSKGSEVGRVSPYNFTKFNPLNYVMYAWTPC